MRLLQQRLARTRAPEDIPRLAIRADLSPMAREDTLALDLDLLISGHSSACV
jgi:hypothetical protein